MKLTYLILLACVLATRLSQSAPAIENEALAPSESQTNSTKFVRLTRDSHGEPKAMETAIVRYVAATPGKPQDLTVDLIAAVHVGEKDYYKQLEREFDRYDVVLYELVAATDRRMAGARVEPALNAVNLLQQGMKDFMQLEHQLEQINYRRTNFVHADMSLKQFKETMAKRGESFLALFLRLMSKAMAEQNPAAAGASDWEILMALFRPDRALTVKRLMAEQFGQLEAAMNDLSGPEGSTIITERNKVALGVLEREIAKGRKRIAIFYGAGHMPDFEARLAQELGLRRHSERWFVAWDLRTKAQRAEKTGPPGIQGASEREPAAAIPVQAERASQFIVVNRTQAPERVSRQDFEEVKRAFPEAPGATLRIGVGYIFSYLRAEKDELLLASLRRVLELATESDTPVLIQIDGEQWWDGRPDLWNWWDPSIPGFDPANRENVEWSGWTPDQALKIAWRNWGRQLRVRPPPNLMSPRYRKACHEKMALVIPVILDWWKGLPAEKRGLFIGLKLGWESSIGVNAWYYPNGNDLLDKPPRDDPASGLKSDALPARGVAQIGYAAVKTAGLRDMGELTEADLAEIARRHLEDLSQQAARLGVPRKRLFTHGAGWKDGELLVQAAVNQFSCPGWSFYKHAADPAKDMGVQEALKRSDAPFWAATEWLYQGPREVQHWRQALENTLADPRCRYLCIYNWEGIRQAEPALQAIRQTLAASTR